MRIKLFPERISKQSAKGNIAIGNFCGIIAQSSIKSVKTTKLACIYQLLCLFLILFIIHGKQNKCNG